MRAGTEEARFVVEGVLTGDFTVPMVWTERKQPYRYSLLYVRTLLGFWLIVSYIPSDRRMHDHN